jgi:hypothetical protein
MNQNGHVSPVKSLTSTRVTGHPSLSCGETLLAFAEWRSLGQVLLVLSREWMGGGIGLLLIVIVDHSLIPYVLHK